MYRIVNTQIHLWGACVIPVAGADCVQYHIKSQATHTYSINRNMCKIVRQIIVVFTCEVSTITLLQKNIKTIKIPNNIHEIFSCIALSKNPAWKWRRKLKI